MRQGREHDVAVTLEAFPFGAAVIRHWGELVYALVFQAIATLVFVRRPDEGAVEAMLVSAAAASSSAIIRTLELQVSDFLNPIGVWLASLVSTSIYMLYYVGILHFALVFPRPHPFIPRYQRSLLFVSCHHRHKMDYHFSTPILQWDLPNCLFPAKICGIQMR